MSNMPASVTMPSPRPCLFSRHHEFADRLWQTLPLPLVFTIAPHACIVCGGRQLHGFDSVDCRSQCVVRHVRGGDGVAASTSDRARLIFIGVSRCRMRLDRGRARLARRDLPSRPCARRLDREPGSLITGTPASEQGQDVLCAVCRPTRQQAMSRQVERTATRDGHETSISGQDASLSSAPRVSRRTAVCRRRESVPTGRSPPLWQPSPRPGRAMPAGRRGRAHGRSSGGCR